MQTAAQTDVTTRVNIQSGVLDALTELGRVTASGRHSRRIVGITATAGHPRSAAVVMRPARISMRFADPALVAETDLREFRQMSDPWAACIHDQVLAVVAATVTLTRHRSAEHLAFGDSSQAVVPRDAVRGEMVKPGEPSYLLSLENEKCSPCILFSWEKS
jgi:hypothetical protein